MRQSRDTNSIKMNGNLLVPLMQFIVVMNIMWKVMEKQNSCQVPKQKTSEKQ